MSLTKAEALKVSQLNTWEEDGGGVGVKKALQFVYLLPGSTGDGKRQELWEMGFRFTYLFYKGRT